MYKKIIAYIKEKYHRTVKTCWIADMKGRCGVPVRLACNRINPDIRTNPCPDEFVAMIKDAFRNFGLI